ncbi:MAG: alkaline phosphatase family protein [Acetobacteraceae bacterium]
MLMQPGLASAQLVIGQPAPAGDIAAVYHDPAQDAAMTQDQLVAALRQRVKYVFILFQENRSFDHYFGTFPGANGLFSDGQKPRPAAETLGFHQDLMDTDGKMTSVAPFRIGPAQHAADVDDVDHGHVRMADKMHLVDGKPQMDRFAMVEEKKYTPAGVNAPPLKAKQFGELAMAYMDCDTVPFMWNYASRFTLFDNIFQTTIGPSTPNAIAMIAGQTGETQWVKHPDAIGPAAAFTIPVTGDQIPFWGSKQDTTTGPQAQPANTVRESSGVNGSNTAPNLTFASLPLTLAGKTLGDTAKTDTRPADLADVQQDVPHITNLGRQPYAWGWYEEGYDKEPNEAASAPAGGSHTSYIGHHNGPQYFGYVSNTPGMSQNLHGLGDFYTDMAAKKLPADGGVFFVRGGYTDITGAKPAFNDGSPEAAAVQRNFLGDDDHPAYSDSELSEGMVARSVNAIARSPYWDQSAIIITYDESEGDYDHVAPRILSFDPAGLPLSRGPRIPLILISPYARAHAVSREEGDHGSVVALINTIFNLPALASLPDEVEARLAGQDKRFATAGQTQMNLGPHDANTPGTAALLSGFDPGRLSGAVPPLPAAYAEIPDTVATTLPHMGGQGCQALGITTVDRQQGITNTIPADFNPRPATFPSK